MAEQKDFLSIKPLDIEKFIKVNELKEVTNPIFFSANSIPTSDGLLSNEIFGITMNSRSNVFAYINLGGKYFIHPMIYAIWKKVDRNIVKCVHSVSNFRLSNEGYLEENEDGETGIDFLRKNISKIHFKQSDSFVRKANIAFLEKFKNITFIKNYIVIPAYYRDVSTDGGKVGVGDINKLYQYLLMACNSLKEMDQLGITTYDATVGRIQDLLLEIYNYFTKGEVQGKTTGAGIAGKFGILQHGVQSKTTDYSSRLIISAPNLKVESMDDLLTDVDHVALPLASAVTNFYPFVLAYVRQFFMNEYNNNPIRNVYPSSTNTKEPKKVKLKDYRISFSDDVLKEEIDRFIHGIANRFRPIELPTEDPKYPIVYINFKGRHATEEEVTNDLEKEDDNRVPITERVMTWCDLLYMAAIEVTADKMVLITRYPIDSCYNQFPCGINVSSTIKTEPMVINHKLYKHYPYIRTEDIGKNTTNKFIDTLNISNVYLGSIGGDYDGDQVTVKSVYSIEANNELRNQLNSKRHFIALGGNNIMETTNEGVAALYALTMNHNSEKEGIYTDPIF